MNEFAFEYNYNCKYCSTKSSLQNLHENFVESLWMNLLLNINIIVSIVQQNLPYKLYKKTWFLIVAEKVFPFCLISILTTKK